MHWKITKFWDRNIWIASLGGFQYLYNTVVVAGAVIFIKKLFVLTAFQEGILVSSALFGALFTALFAGVLGNWIGRRAAMGLSALLFLIGSLVAAYACNFEILLLGRLITGLGAGIITLVVPVYLTEIAPAKSRGAVVNFNQITMAIGMLAAYLCNFAFSESENWRWMFGLGAVPAALQLVGLFFIKESPHWLQDQSVQEASWKDLVQPLYRSRLKIGLALCTLQQITGISAVLLFAPTIFEDAGYCDASDATLATVYLGIANAIAILISFWYIDRKGRRFLLLTGMWGMVVTLCLLALALFFPSGKMALVAVSALMLYMAAYAIGVGPITPLLVSEIFPLKARAHAMTLTGFMGWLFNYLVALSFLSFSDLFTPAGVFCLYAVFGLLGLYFIQRSVPETKGKSLAQIDKFFTS
jgi:SP family galactose:H+ symporter-like MFS transporter